VKRVALLAACALAGCASIDVVKPIKAYEGAERPAAELATLETAFTRDLNTVSDVQIAAIDGANHARPQYQARMLPGEHWVALRHISQVGSVKREQFCAADLDVAPGCTYRPYPPSHPSGFSSRGGDPAPWRASASMEVTVRCPDLSAAIRVPVECASSSLCRGAATCPLPGMRCADSAGYSYGVCERY